MAGFTALFSNNIIPVGLSFRKKDIFSYQQHFITEKIVGKTYIIERSTNNKFLNDKVFQEDDDFIIVQEGVLLNLDELMQQNPQKDTFHLLKSLYLLHGNTFVDRLRGDFSGLIYNKKEHLCFAFTNHTGAKRVFYYQHESIFIVASEMGDIAHLMGQLDQLKRLNIQAAYLLLTYGFMLEEHTLIEDVKRLVPGNYLTYQHDALQITEYFHLKHIQKTTDSKEQIINKLDDLFAKAIKAAFEKDKSYGYKHMATLSGGLDSRMTVLVAHKLGYTNQLNFTFSQANYLDETIAKRIAIDFKHDFIFQSLNGGNYLKAIDTNIALNDGLMLYSVSAHVLHAIELLNFNDYGLIHTGMMGDAVIGSFLSKPYPVKAAVTDGMYSTYLASEIKGFISTIIDTYPDEELFKFYGHGFLGALNGNYTLDMVSQGVTPFLDVEFMCYCVSIPEELKFKQKIYLEWMAAKHPELTRYPWEKTGVSPLKSRNFKKYLDIKYYRRMRMKLVDKLSRKMQSGMSPFDYWMTSNPSLQNHIEVYFKEHIPLLNQQDALQKHCMQLFKRGNAVEKFQVITLLAAIQQHDIKH